MEDKDFDKHIKEKLSDLATDKKVDWSDMHKLLVEEELVADDHVFDEIIKSEMNSTKAPYQESHWAKLHERLLTEAYLRKRLLVAKSVELLMLLLFVCSTLTLVPLQQKELYAIHKYRPQLQNLSALVTDGYDAVVALVASSRLQSEVWTEADFTMPDTYESWTQYTDTQNLEVTTLIAKLEPLPTTIRPLPVTAYARGVSPTLEPIAVVTHQHRSNPFVGVTAGAALNIVDDQFKNSDGSETMSLTDLDYQLDVSYGMRFKKLDAYTGVGISRTNYTPQVNTGLFDSYRGVEIPLSQINDISYTFVNIPLGLRSHIIQRSQWSIYAALAVNINLLGRADYHFKELTPLEVKWAESEPAGFVEGNLRADLDSDLSKGFLQGASLAQSINTSATFGIGISAAVSNRVHLMLQPSYTKSFAWTGAGAQNERIDNFRLDVGLSIFL